MESWTMTSLPLSGGKGLSLSAAKGRGDGRRPDVGVPQTNRESGNGESEAGSRTRASLFYEPVCATPSQGRRKKGQFLGETKPLGGLE